MVFSTTRGHYVPMTITQDTGAEGWYVTEWLLEMLQMDHQPLAKPDEILLRPFGQPFPPIGMITPQWHARNRTEQGQFRRGREKSSVFYVISKKVSDLSIQMLLGRDALQDLQAIAYRGIWTLRKSQKKRTAG